MNSFRWNVVRSVAPVLAVLFAAPIAGASTIATSPQGGTAMHGTASAPVVIIEQVGERERRQQIALLVSADSNDISRSLRSRFPPASAASDRAEFPEMGLQLPEPGPVSAIIATLALAGFVMIRRLV